MKSWSLAAWLRSHGRRMAIRFWQADRTASFALASPIQQVARNNHRRRRARDEGHAEPAQAVLFTRDGKKGISASLDKTIRLFDLKTGEKLHRFEHDNWVFCAALVGDKQLITGSKDHTLRLWDLENRGQVCNIDAGGEVRGSRSLPMRGWSQRVATTVIFAFSSCQRAAARRRIRRARRRGHWSGILA